MPRHLAPWHSLLTTLACTALLLGRHPVTGQSSPTDLDRLSVAQFGGDRDATTSTALGISVGAERVSVSSYRCSGDACCDYPCTEVERCVLTPGGLIAPAWWGENGGALSCEEKVAANYDPTIPCSRVRVHNHSLTHVIVRGCSQ